MQPTTAIGFSPTTPAPISGYQNTIPQSDNGQPLQKLSECVPNTGGVSVKTANYTAVAGDCGLLLSFNSASAITLTLPASIPFAQWNIGVQNVGTGVLTVNRNGLDIDGAATNLTLSQGSGVAISTDGTNYFTERGAAIALTLEHDGAANGSQTLLNLKSSSTITVSDDGSGGISLNAINVATPVLRGSGIASSNSTSTLTVSLPSGSAVGDLALIFGYGGNPPVPSGWTSLSLASAPIWQGMGAWKLLTSGDISTGSVSVSGYGFSFDGVLALAVFIGPCGGIREVESNDDITGTPLTNTTTGAVLNTDAAIYFATGRSDGGALPAIAPGSGSTSTLQTALTTGIGASSSILASQEMPGGALAVVNTWPSGSQGAVAAQVIVIGVATTVGTISSLTGDVTASGSGAVPATLVTVNSDVGSFTNANLTVNAKGLITAASNGSASGISLTTTGSSGAATLTGTVLNIPNYAGGGGGGALVFLEGHTAVSGTDSHLDFTSWYSSLYDNYVIEVVNLTPSTSGLSLGLLCSTNGGTSYDTGSNYYTSQFSWSTGGDGVNGPGSSTSILLAPLNGRSLSTSSTFTTSGTFKFYNPGSTTLYKNVLGEFISPDSAGNNPQRLSFNAAYEVTSAVNALRFAISSGTFSAVIRIYGLSH